MCAAVPGREPGQPARLYGPVRMQLRPGRQRGRRFLRFCSCLDSIIESSVSFPSETMPGYSVEMDVVANHDTTEIGGLEGMKTYRLYVRMAEPGDKVTAAFGNELIPLGSAQARPSSTPPSAARPPTASSRPCLTPRASKTPNTTAG